MVFCPSPPSLFWYIYTMEFYAAERKKELIPFAMAWMELESIMLNVSSFLFALYFPAAGFRKLPLEFLSSSSTAEGNLQSHARVKCD